MPFANPDLLVTTDWLAEHLDDPDLRVFECTVFLRPRDGGGYRVEGGIAEWEAGHIPGSGFLDLQQDFSDNDQRLRFMMLGEAAFAEAAGRQGIAETDRIVLYDRLGSMWAARLWWMFRAMGATRAAVLDGGWTKWLAEGRAVSTEPPTYAPATFNARFDAARFADREEMVATLNGGACVINALGRDQHSGADGGRTYGRAGHIPRQRQRAGDGADRPADAGVPGRGDAGAAVRRGRRGARSAGDHLLRRRDRGEQRRLRALPVGLRGCRGL